MTAWTSPVSTRAVVSSAVLGMAWDFRSSFTTITFRTARKAFPRRWRRVKHPTTIPCSAGRCSPFRHSSGSNRTWVYVFLISPLVAHRAVPCCPWPTVLALMLRLYIPDNPAIRPRVANMAVPAITNFTIGCKKSTPFWFSAILNAEKKKGRESSTLWKIRSPISFLQLVFWFTGTLPVTLYDFFFSAYPSPGIVPLPLSP